MDLRRGDAGDQAPQRRTAGPAQGDRITLNALGTRLLSPDSTLVSGWDRAIVHGEAEVQRVVDAARTGVGPELAAELRDACRAAAALLAAGRREPARSLIRVLSRAAVAAARSAALAPALGDLIASFRAWTGDTEFLGKYLAPPPDSAVPGAGSGAAGANPMELIDRVVQRIWGLVPEAIEERLSVALHPPAGQSEMSLTGLRIGPTTLALRYRLRAGQVLLHGEVTRGPGLRVEMALSGVAVTRVSVDEVALGGGRAVFRAAGTHEVVFELAAGS